MRIDLHVHLEDKSASSLIGQVLRKLDFLHTQLTEVVTKENKIMAKIDDVLAATEAQTTVTASVVSLLNKLSQMVKDAGTDPAKLDAVLAAIAANTQAAADAVVANTPAETQPPV